MPTTTYELGVSGTAFTGAANREDLLDVVTILSPTDTPLFTMFRKAQISNVQVEWLTDTLDIAASNAQVEGSSAVFTNATARVRLSNYAQISREQYDISDTQRAVNPERQCKSLQINDLQCGARSGNVAMNTWLYARTSEHAELREAA